MKRRVQITIDPQLLKWADALACLRHSNRSELIEQLIRDEYERRRGPLRLDDPKPAARLPGQRNTTGEKFPG